MKTHIPLPKVPFYETSILWNPYKGIYKVTTYFTDGSQETTYVPKGLIILPATWGVNGNAQAMSLYKQLLREDGTRGRS